MRQTTSREDLFLGDFSESQTRSVELSRSPDLFRVIVDYLSGYDILPLNGAAVPSMMTPDIAHKNPLHDAGFYGLQGLVKLLSSAPTPQRFSAACDAFLLGKQAVNFEDVLRGKLPSGVTFDERGVGTIDGEKWLAAPNIALDALLVVDYVYIPGSPSLVFGLISPSSQPLPRPHVCELLAHTKAIFHRLDESRRSSVFSFWTCPHHDHSQRRGSEWTGVYVKDGGTAGVTPRGETRPIDVHLREIFS